jgi:DNA-binding response OmpR family regulator
MDYDPEQTGHILTNLISNAVKFTTSGGFVTVRLDRLPQEMLLIEVKDTGIGIAQDHLSQIFQRFYQVDSSTTREREGTGIGLAHTHELVKLMGGDIQVESEVGRGSTFRVFLPIRLLKSEDTVSDLESTAALKQKAEILAPNLSGGEIPEQDLIPETEDRVLPKILLVEDNHDTVTLLISCLAERYEIDFAENGQIGVEKALKTIPDLIISDVMMPGTSGLDLCRILKNDEKTSHIPIILLTAKADMDSKITGLATGADAYLYKPFKKKELLVRLEAMMEKQRKLLAHFAKKFENGIVSRVEMEEEVEDMPTAEDEFIEQIRTIVAENYYEENFTMMDICEQIDMSRSQLYRKMKALVDVSPSEFIRKYRLEKAKILLETTDMNASQVAYATGYKDPSHFSKSFLDEFNIHPSNASKKGE